MKKIFFFIVVLPVLSFANLTKDDLKEIRSIVKEEVKAEVGALEKKMDAKFEAVDKRFEAVDKRFEMLQHNMDKRFEQMDKRFEQMDKRFDDQMSFLYLLTTIFTAFTGGVIGFALWDRRSIVDKSKQESLQEFKKEIANDISKLDKIVQIIEELAKVDERVAKILEKHHLKLI